jgi:hypothetical protein
MSTPVPRTPDVQSLADVLTAAATEVCGVLTTPYPTAPSRSYLHPVLGPLAAGPHVAVRLADRLDDLAEPASTAELFALGSLASALGWLTESLITLIADVDAVCTLAGLPDADPAPGPLPVPDDTHGLSTIELASVRAAAALCDLSPTSYAAALGAALRAAARVDTGCTEIAEGLRTDAAALLAPERLASGGPDSLPHLVHTLLTRTETGR